MKELKVIEGLDRCEVLKRICGGEKAAYRINEAQFPFLKISGNEWREKPDFVRCQDVAYECAIIDTPTPEIDWDKVDWPFFNQYGGIPIQWELSGDRDSITNIPDGGECSLRVSPPYYWPGGDQPVPDGVEVEMVFSDKRTSVNYAKHINWRGGFIAFKLTGRVL